MSHFIFSSRRYSIVSFLVIVLALSGLNTGCKKLPNTEEGNSIELTQAIKAPVGIAFIDANRFLDAQIPKLKVTIIDPNSMVLTSNGLPIASNSVIEIEGGVMSLGLSPRANISDTLPYRFTIMAEAEGYVSNFQNILISKDEAQYVPVYLAKVDDLPAGMAAANGTLPISQSTTTEDLLITPEISNGVSRLISVSILKGTTFTSKKERLPDNIDKLSYQISFVAPGNVASGRTFPGGPLVTDAVDQIGQVLASPGSPFYFATAGWVTMEIKAGDELVSDFDKPITVALPIGDTLINPLTNAPYQKGDTINVWSSNKGIWKLENTSIVEKGDGGLWAKFKMTHLSTWNLDFKQNQCLNDITVNYSNPGPAFSAYSELINGNTGIAYGVTNLGDVDDNILSYVSDEGSFTIANAPGNTDVEFRMYNSQDGPVNLRAQSGIFTTCSNPASVMNIPSAGTQQTTKLVFYVTLNNVDYALCQNAVWYKSCPGCPNAASCLANTNAYNFGGVLSPGNTTAGSVTLRKFSSTDFVGPHCIRLWYGQTANGNKLIQQAIDFSVNLSASDPVSAIPAGVTIVHDYDEVTDTHTFRITAGVTGIDAGSCNPPIPVP